MKRVMKRKPKGCIPVEGGFFDAAGERWSKTPEGYRPNSDIFAEMQRTFG